PNVAHRANRLLDAAGYPLITGRAHRVPWPVHERCGTVLGPPLLVDGVEVLGECEGCSAAVLSDDRRNRQVGQLQSRIGACYPLVVPVGDRPGEDSDVRLPGQFQLGAVWQVVRQCYASGGERYEQGSVSYHRHLVVTHGGVAGTKIDPVAVVDVSRDEPSDALAAPHRLIGNHGAGMGLLVQLKPLFVKDRGKSRPRAPKPQTSLGHGRRRLAVRLYRYASS